jgi:hypothetical protein
LVFRQYVGQFGLAEMILFLTDKREQFFCRLFFVRRNGYSYGHICFRRTSGVLWILDAAVYSRSRRTVISRLLDGVILVGFEMARFCTFHL